MFYCESFVEIASLSIYLSGSNLKMSNNPAKYEAQN